MSAQLDRESSENLLSDSRFFFEKIWLNVSLYLAFKIRSVNAPFWVEDTMASSLKPL
ncbi:hypothetical protein LCGC14_0484320 [marine sediment metagenome]|uniref:Uncharacterized protein n=1 Tax=marine sediment metagenome TaxID=412755 RepID=A0A0F9SRT5_9ZZZZ